MHAGDEPVVSQRESEAMQARPLGMFAWFGYRLPLEQRVKLIAQADFSTTCPGLGEEEELIAGKAADEMPADRFARTAYGRALELQKKLGQPHGKAHAPSRLAVDRGN
jgi:hypothetical protein